MGAPLKGLIYDPTGQLMSPVSARRKGGATYRYYVSRSLQVGGRPDPQTLQRVPASLIEDLVYDRMSRVGLAGDDANGIDWTHLRAGLIRVELGSASVNLHLKPNAHVLLGDPAGLAARLGPSDQVDISEDGIRLTLPARFSRRSGVLVALNPAGGDAIARVRHDRTLSTALIRAEAWKRQLRSGAAATLEDLALFERVPAGYVARMIRVAFLAPQLKRAILDGLQPASLTLQAILTRDLPLEWAKQRELYRS